MKKIKVTDQKYLKCCKLSKKKLFMLLCFFNRECKLKLLKQNKIVWWLNDGEWLRNSILEKEIRTMIAEDQEKLFYYIT